VPDDTAEEIAAKQGGIEVGEEAAATMLEARDGDGRGGSFTFVFGTTAGVWRLGPQQLPNPAGGFFAPGQPVDPTPWVGNVTPFLVPNVEMLRTDGPNPLGSAAYAEDFNEVKSLGSLTNPGMRRTPDQTMAAIFWQAQPGLLYGNVMRTLSTDQGLDIADNARLFAMVFLAAADASIGCWNDKYYWNFWRPITAIRLTDPTWTPLFDPSLDPAIAGIGPPLITPPYPDHVSGATAYASASMHALASFFGTDELTFYATSSRFPGEQRAFTRFSDLTNEILGARIWAGIHFRYADVQAESLGREVESYIYTQYFAFVH
jgi:hypothetical protein